MDHCIFYRSLEEPPGIPAFCGRHKQSSSVRSVSAVDSSCVEGVSVDLQADVVHCGTVQAASLSASPSRLVVLLSTSQVKRLSELMAIIAD